MRKIVIKQLYTNVDDQLRRYFLDIRRIPVMTPEEENELIARLPDPEARERLINANLRFVVSIAKIYQGNGLELMDLISLGNLGLCKSVEYYNKDYNVKFLSYAGWWIKQAIINGLSEDVKPVIAPNVVRHAFNKIKRVVNEYFAQYGTEPDQEYIMEHAKITPSEYNRAMMCFVSFASLSDTAGSDEHDKREIGETLVADDATFEDDMDDQGTSEAIRDMMADLPWRERMVIKYSFGFDCQALPVSKIAKLISITPERVRQIKAKVLAEFKKKIRRDGL